MYDDEQQMWENPDLRKLNEGKFCIRECERTVVPAENDLPDDYIDYVFGEIDNVRYEPDIKLSTIVDVLKRELGAIGFLNKFVITTGDYKDCVVDGLKLNFNKTLSVLLNTEIVDIFLFEDEVMNNIVEYTNEQIKYNKYL